MRHHIVGPAVDEHHDRLATSRASVGEVQREAALAAAGSAGHEVCATLSKPCQPVIEESDPTWDDAASAFAFPLHDASDDEVGTMVEADSA